MKSKIKQWTAFTLSTLSFLGVIAWVILTFGFQTEITPVNNARTRELLNETTIECDQYVINNLLAVACTANYWGRWMWYWRDAAGTNILLQDDLHAREVGALFSTNPSNLEIYFTSIDGRKAFLELTTISVLRDCTAINGCLRVDHTGGKQWIISN